MATGGAGGARGGAALNHVRERYDFDAWREVPPRDEYLHIWRFFLADAALPGWRLARAQPMAARPPWPRSLQSVWRSGSDDGVLASVFVFECPGLAEAREALLTTLGDFQAAVERTEGHGDVAFALPNENVVLFALANLVLLVRNAGEKVTPMTDVAAALERHVAEPPEPGGPATPEIQLFAGGDPAGDRGAVPLAVEASDPLGRRLWLRLSSRTGEVREEGDRLVFSPRAAGPHEIVLYAVNENGGAATRTLVLGDSGSSAG